MKRVFRFTDNLDSDCPFRFMHLLVVEDHADTREILEYMLRQAGARVTAVESTEDALVELEKDDPIDAVVTDIGLPGADGYALFKSVGDHSRERGVKVPVIAVTAYATELDKEKAIRLGFDAYLAKPIYPDDLIRTIAVATTARAA
jgi:CheY-like chemotaxis protein